MSNKFEDFLQHRFLKEYHGDKDSYENAYENWLENKDVAEMCDFAEEAVQNAYLEGKDEVLKAFAPHLDKLKADWDIIKEKIK